MAGPLEKGVWFSWFSWFSNMSFIDFGIETVDFAWEIFENHHIGINAFVITSTKNW